MFIITIINHYYYYLPTTNYQQSTNQIVIRLDQTISISITDLRILWSFGSSDRPSSPIKVWRIYVNVSETYSRIEYKDSAVVEL